MESGGSLLFAVRYIFLHPSSLVLGCGSVGWLVGWLLKCSLFQLDVVTL